MNKKPNPYHVIEAQANVIKKPHDNLVKTVLEANIITGKYSEGIAIADSVIKTLTEQLDAAKARIGDLEVDALNRTWQK